MAQNTKKDRMSWNAGDIVWIKKPQGLKNTTKKTTQKKGKK